MTNELGELASVQMCRARAALRQAVENLLRGSGLEVREMANGLAISNPRDPDRGRIYISYANGDVSWKRVIWDFLGSLQGYDGDDPDREPCVDAAKIIAVLTGKPGPGETS
jgi:hypothetical protein